MESRKVTLDRARLAIWLFLSLRPWGSNTCTGHCLGDLKTGKKLIFSTHSLFLHLDSLYLPSISFRTQAYVASVLSHFSPVRLFATLWTVAHQAAVSMGFSRQEYWSGLPCPPAGDLPNLGIEPMSLMSPALTGGFFPTSTTWEAHTMCHSSLIQARLHKQLLSSSNWNSFLGSQWFFPLISLKKS